MEERRKWKKWKFKLIFILENYYKLGRFIYGNENTVLQSNIWRYGALLQFILNTYLWQDSILYIRYTGLCYHTWKVKLNLFNLMTNEQWLFKGFPGQIEYSKLLFRWQYGQRILKRLWLLIVQILVDDMKVDTISVVTFWYRLSFNGVLQEEKFSITFIKNWKPSKESFPLTNWNLCVAINYCQVKRKEPLQRAFRLIR